MRVAALCNHVPRVVFLGANKQVPRITARRIIALVTYAQPFRDRPACEFPSNNVRVGKPFVPFASSNLPMSVGVAPSHPRPALVFFANLNLAPKPQFERRSPSHHPL